jgi:hypothetical protein
VAILLVMLVAAPALPCSFCNPDLKQTATFRQDAAQAKFIVYGVVTRSTFQSTPGGGGGTSQVEIKATVKPDDFLKGKSVLDVPRYVPVTDPKDPPKYLLFCDVFQGKLDVFRGTPIKSEAAASYVKGLVEVEGKGTPAVLRYCFDYLEHADPEIATDAFLEFIKATDRDIAAVAPKLSPEKLRVWLTEPKTPDFRLGLYAFLLGGCGGEKDAALLRSLIEKPSDRSLTAFDGLLGGYIQMRPKEGWELAQSILKDERRAFAVRYAVIRMLRFYHAWKPDESRNSVLRNLAVVLKQSDIADLAVEDLRRWGEWDLTDDVLRLYGQKGYEAPLMQQALARYALTCPKPESAKFVANLRRDNPDLYKRVSESLQFDKKP